MNFKQTNCLITGASGGIGSAFARAMNEKGARLILTGRNPEKLHALDRELGSRHEILQADINTEQGRWTVVEHIINNKEINLVVQSAGSSSFGLLTTQSSADLEQAVHLNLLVPMLIIQAVLPSLLAREHTTVVNVGSAFGSIGFPGFSSYCASKFGLRGFTESLQRELAGTTVNIKYFAPRATQTPFNSSVINELNEALGNKIDSPEAVAGALVNMLLQDRKRVVVGWPEKLFCRLNGLLPEIVDTALSRKLKTITHYARQQRLEGVSP